MSRASKAVGLLVIVASLTLGALLAVAVPQENADKPLREPAALEIMQRADRALAEVDALEFDFEKTGTYGSVGRTTGHAVVDRVDNYMDLRYRASVTSHVKPRSLRGLGREVELASDGEMVWLVDHEERVTQVGSAGGGAVALQMPMSEFVMPLMFRPLQSVEIDLPERMSVAGTAAVGGVLCDVVYLDFPDDGPYGEQYFYVGREDHLPRRIVLVGASGQGSASQFDFVMTDLRTVEAAPDRFRLEAPEGYAVDDDAMRVAPGAVAEDWELTTSDGETVRLRDLRGKVVVLDFWASWCPICRNQLPMISEVVEEYDGQPVEFYGVNAWESGDPLAFLEEVGATNIPVFLQGDDLAQRYRIAGTGTIVVIGPDGKFLPRLFGTATRENLVQAIESALPAADEMTADTTAPAGR